MSGWMQQLIKRHNNKARCLVCDRVVDDGAAVVKYKYQGGEGQAFVCKKCGDDMEKNKLDGDFYESI